MILILVSAAWAKPQQWSGPWWPVYCIKWYVVVVQLARLGLTLWRWFTTEQIVQWVGATKACALQIMPLLFGGVLAAGFLLGMPGSD